MQISKTTLPIALALRRAHQIAPRLRGWQRIFRAAFNPATQSDYEFEIPLFEGTFVGHANHWVDWYALFFGCYERALVMRMREFLKLKTHPIVLDIGANVGHHSVALAGVAGHVHAFEPYPPRLAALSRNVQRNPHFRITVHPIGLGGEDFEAPFRLPTTGEWAGVQFDPQGTLRFPVRDASNYLEQRGIERADLIKIDVDGNERDVFRGLRRFVESSRPIIVTELGWVSAREVADILPDGYKFTHLGADTLICHP